MKLLLLVLATAAALEPTSKFGHSQIARSPLLKLRGGDKNEIILGVSAATAVTNVRVSNRTPGPWLLH